MHYLGSKAKLLPFIQRTICDVAGTHLRDKVFCAIWGYSWLEVWRDPKGELADFYARHPRTKAWVSLANRLWVPTLFAGLVSIVMGVMILLL